MLAPLLQEVRVPAGHPSDRLHGIIGDSGGLCLDGFAHCGNGGVVTQGIDGRKVEEPFGVGLRPTHLPRKLRKASSEECDGKRALRASVQGHGQRGQLALVDVLQLVDKQDQRRLGGLGRFACGFKERQEILIEVAVVSETWFRFVVDANLDVAELHLQRPRKTGQRSQAPDRQVGGLGLSAEPEKRQPELRCQHRRQGSVLRRFDTDRLQRQTLGKLADPV